MFHFSLNAVLDFIGVVFFLMHIQCMRNKQRKKLKFSKCFKQKKVTTTTTMQSNKLTPVSFGVGGGRGEGRSYVAATKLVGVQRKFTSGK